MSTSIVLDTSAPVTRNAELNDKILNTLSAQQSRWSFELKMYRANPASAPEEKDASPRPSFLYTVTFSQNAGDFLVLTDKDRNGTVMQGDFDIMLNTKLQSLWILRQTYKGEGQAYTINGGEFTIRMANMSLLGSYKGIVVEVEAPKDKIGDLFERLGWTSGNTSPVEGRMAVAAEYIEKLTR